MGLNVPKFIDEAIAEIRRQVEGRAVIGLSGGVDSSVCAFLAREAIGVLTFQSFVLNSNTLSAFLALVDL